MNRRAFLASTAAAFTAPSLLRGETAALDFSFSVLQNIARSKSEQPYRPYPKVPKEWLDLSYEQYRNIRFDTRKAILSDPASRLRVDLFAAGLYFPTPVMVNTVSDGVPEAVVFDYDRFHHPKTLDALPLAGMGHSGIRLRAELEKPGVFTEFAVFQGASYFRMIGTGLTYGLSARGLALSTGDSEGEEFPEFTDFWVERSEDPKASFRVWALLDSASVTGAYQFTIMPGPETVAQVEATIYPRTELDHVGIAPLTSMFFFDQTNRNEHDDFRPAVHDNDGLMILNGMGEQIWRPLANPKTLQVSSFVDENPRGFGFGQRARDYSDFVDLEALYHNRPALWIEPGEDWGAGVVRLVEIPTTREIYDNIVAYWRPRDPLPAGQPHSFSYTMTWCAQIPQVKPVARVLDTHIGKNFTGEKELILIDFEKTEDIPEDYDQITIHTSTNRGRVSGGVLQTNPETGGPRLAFSLEPPTNGRGAELRAQLMKDGKSLTEVWLYRWTA